MSEHNHHVQPVGKKLKIAIMLTAFTLVVEVVGGLLANSLALLSDAGHVFADIVALSLSWYGIRQAERPASSRMTFGYHRVGVLVAIVNAFSIFAVAAVILYEAYRRLLQPPEVNSLLMMAIAVVGLGVNAVVAYWLRQEQRANLNVRSAFWHALGDALASIGVIVGGIIMLLTGLFWVDPVIAAIIGIIITLSGWRILEEGFKVLLEATPRHVDISQMIDILRHVPGVKDVHDVHVWSITPELHAMSAHVLIEDLYTSEAASIRQKIEDALQNQFRITHTTLQMECQMCNANDTFCYLTSPEPHEEKDEHRTA